MIDNDLISRSDALKAVDIRHEELLQDIEYRRKHCHIDLLGIKKHILAIPPANILKPANDDLISRDALKKVLCEEYEAKEHYIGEKMLEAIDNAPTVSIKSCCECPFVADEEKQITNGDAWKSYCEGQEVGFKKAEDVFERMKLIQETVDCIRNKFNLNTESNKLVRNCMALVQNAIDGEYHDMEEVDMKRDAE